MASLYNRSMLRSELFQWTLLNGSLKASAQRAPPCAIPASLKAIVSSFVLLMMFHGQLMSQDDTVHPSRNPSRAVHKNDKDPSAASPSAILPEKYRTFGNVQIYESPSEVWLFLDVDLVVIQDQDFPGLHSANASVSFERQEFHAYVFGKTGLLWRSIVKDSPITAHPPTSVFFRKGHHTYAYMFGTQKLYRWEVAGRKRPSFVLKQDAEPVLQMPVTTRGWLLKKHLLKMGRDNGFRKIGDGMYMGSFTATDYVSEDLDLRIHFVHRFGTYGACGAIAESTSKQQYWKTVLLELSDPKNVPDKRPREKRRR